MAARERPTASYAQIPFATLPDRAAMATRQRTDDAKIEHEVAATVSRTIAAAPQQWAHARATDIAGETVRVRGRLADRDDPA